MESDWSGRWNHVRKFVERGGPFAHPDFEPSTEALGFLQDVCKILVIGAGGLGCELLKDLALMGFRNLDVIDMDTIDVSNLNRQFLFRHKDVGKPKAEVAAAFINKRVPGCKVTPHYCQIQDYDESFYRKFHIVVCGLDSIVARRWINGMLISLLKYEDGELDQSTLIPMVDGGTEGFKGNARVILTGVTACIECTLDLYPPQFWALHFLTKGMTTQGNSKATKINFPLCTIAHTPRLPEHCIEYVRILLWPKEEPFGGVVKRIIPAVASTNAVIAAACSTEVFKLATSCCLPLNNYMNFSDIDGIYTYAFEAMKKEDCIACTNIPKALKFSDGDKLQDILTYLIDSAEYQMKSPGITTSLNGKNKTLYMQTVKSIEEKTRENLKKTLNELGLRDGQEVYIADPTTPNTITFKLTLGCNME
ncbi:NEDD8-activating enzyme E1 catalytic subunit-like isoform X3 [Mytilus trossulus]|uniref:NEDD8-activating enzyme E1 catalytic subunit-like isoform X3 n=1 Tax=Mytilus trossulus TaxID=6551 RepID=UPI0030066470